MAAAVPPVLMPSLARHAAESVAGAVDAADVKHTDASVERSTAVPLPVSWLDLAGTAGCHFTLAYGEHRSVIALADGSAIRVVEPATGTLLREARLCGKATPVLALTHVPEHQFLCLGRPGGEIRVLEDVSLVERSRIATGADAYCLAALPDGLLAAPSPTGGIGIWEAWSATLTRSLVPPTPCEYCCGLALLPDASTLVSAHSSGDVHLWDWRGGACLLTLARAHTG